MSSLPLKPLVLGKKYVIPFWVRSMPSLPLKPLALEKKYVIIAIKAACPTCR